jgi:hypothetical protein
MMRDRALKNAATPQLRLPGGRGLDRGVRGLMETRFRADFDAVRVHTGAAAAQATDALSAKAFTRGSDIVFGANQYAPDSDRGRGLLAHELAHVTQQQGGVGRTGALSRTGDGDERAAGAAVDRLARGGDAGPSAPAAAGVQREPKDAPTLSLPLLPRAPAVQSQAETVMESFLGRTWDKQSKSERDFRLTPTVMQGLRMVFPFGAPIGAITEWKSSRELLDQLRGKLPQTIDANTQKALDSLPDLERPLPALGLKRDADPATPKLEVPGDPGKPADPLQPGKGQGGDEAAKEALKAAAEQFRKTKLGQELEKLGKDYVLSKKGIPLIAIVSVGAIAFVAANDPSIPSTPDIPVGEGVTLKLEVSAKGSELSPLLSDLVHGHSEPGPEKKIGVSATFTWGALADFGAAIGHFFAEAATWIGKGVVKAGTIIGKAAKSALPEILATLGGAALGAGIGAIAGGGLGAAIGAGIGAGVGLGAALIKRLVSDR